MENESQVKVALLQQRLEDLKHIVIKIDDAIEKLSEVNSNVSKMLAVHEERISRQEEVDNILFDKIDKLRDKMDSDHDGVTSRLSVLERKLWVGLGVLGAIVALSNPQAIKVLKPLLSSANSGTIPAVVTYVNGSR